MKTKPTPHYRIRTLAQLRRERERIDWQLGACEESLRHDYRHIRQMLTLANIVQMAVTHIQGVHEMIETGKESLHAIRSLFNKRSEPHEKEALPASQEATSPAVAD